LTFKYFSINYSVIGGRKCVTKDRYLSNFISPSIPDQEGEGIVKSLSYAPVEGLGKSLGWMTNGSLAMSTQIENG
jgi:hypothetical protein